jgi:hypothetical protein
MAYLRFHFCVRVQSSQSDVAYKGSVDLTRNIDRLPAKWVCDGLLPVRHELYSVPRTSRIMDALPCMTRAPCAIA